MSVIILAVIVIGIVTVVGLWIVSKESIPDENSILRKMAVAGSFYPLNKNELNSQLNKYLTVAKKSDGKTRILIAPHAGLVYSGKTAAFAYKQVEGQNNIKRVIIIGSSHKNIFDYAALLTSGSFETPLGDLEIDQDFSEMILSPSQKIISDAKVHEGDHVLEMQAIFVKKVLPKAKIIPILVSQTTPELVSALAFRIAQNMDEETLLIISTDLSHYPDYETANLVDKNTIESILSFSEIRQMENIETTACGIEAIKVAHKVAQLLGIDKPVLLKYENSGDTSGDKSRVVGYAAIGFFGDQIDFSIPQLSDDAKKEALELSRKTLREFVIQKSVTQVSGIKNAELLLPLGAFVTLKKDGVLRGCIGEFEPIKTLAQVVIDKTIAAASEDLRFDPIISEELENISLEISVMTPKRKIANYSTIKLGQDGVVIRNGNYSGTFLPQVATEAGWSLETFMEQLCSQKAGLPIKCYLDPKTEIFTYQTQTFQN